MTAACQTARRRFKSGQYSPAGAKSYAPAAPPVTLRLQGPAVNDEKQSPADSPSNTGPTNTEPPATPSELPPAPKAESPAADSPKTAKAGPIHWAAVDQNEAQGNDDIRVTVSKVALGNFFYRSDSSILDNGETTYPLLHIWVKVENHQIAGRIEYKGWMSLADADVLLMDDQGNEINRIDLSKLVPHKQVQAAGGHPTASIGNSESNEDLIVFDLPRDGAKYLRLKLAGKAVGLTDDLYFQIPQSMIKQGETGNPIVPSGQ